MAELLRAIFISDEFMPHGHCFLWKPGLLWLHVTSDGLSLPKTPPARRTRL